MSVILDALQKARGDKKDNDSHKNATAKVLEPTTSARPFVIREKSGGRTLLTVFLTAFVVLLIVAVGLVIFYLFNRLNVVEQQAKAAASPATVSADSAVQPAVAAVPTPFPTPLPIQDLPVQPPPQSAPLPTTAMVTDAVPASASAAVDAKKMFTLGSIVCENNDCLASINNQTVRVGDSVRGGYTVTDIHSSGLTLTGPDKQQITLSLFD